MNNMKLKKVLIFAAFFIFVFHIFFSVGYSNIKIETADLKLINNDAYIYRDIAENGFSNHYEDHRSTRVLIPGLSYLFSRINYGGEKFNTPGVNIFFVSSIISFLSLISLVYLTKIYFDTKTSLLVAAFFLLSFSMSNYMFMGYPDTAEFLLSTLLFIALSQKRYFYIIPIFLIAALNRESFILFASPVIFTWSLYKENKNDRIKILSIGVAASILFLLIIYVLKTLLQDEQDIFVNQIIGWVGFNKFLMYIDSNHIRMFLYSMILLLPLGLIGAFVKKELFYLILTICFIYFIVGGLFIGSGAAVGRYLFSSAGPLLLIGQACLLRKIYNYYNETYNSNTLP